MRRSNRSLTSPPGKPWAFDYFLCPGSGEFDLYLGAGWGKLNRKSKVSNDFLFLAPKSPTAVNTCLDQMEDFKGRVIAIN